MAGDDELHIAAGDEKLRRGDRAGAERDYRLALAINPQSASAMQSIGYIHAERGDYPNALTWAQRALVADPDFAPAHNLAGNCLLALKRYAEALPALTKTLEAASRRMKVGILHQLAICHGGLGRWEEAERDLRTALEEDPTYATRFAPVGMITHDPLYADCHLALSCVLGRQGNVEESVLHKRLARRMDPTVAFTPLAEEVFVGRRKPPDGRRTQPAIFLEPLIRMAAAFRQAEQAAIFEAGQSPPVPSAADEFERGLRCFQTFDHAEAAKIFSALCAGLPDQAAPHYALGVVWLQDRHSDALQALCQAARLAPEDRDVKVALNFAQWCLDNSREGEGRR